ncbi:MAG: hypothetical protein C0507_14395 [Cyanobacteria bacterium PR.3.49]|nr:hypothetical protein [Cyanobacteria bacterium PR.3.49]
MKARKLNEQEFEHAIKLGLGRAVLHVRDYGDEGMEDVLRKAMLNSNIFDSMFEDTRAWWIFKILCKSKNLNNYADYLMDHITDTSKSLDSQHQMILAAFFYEQGFADFKPIIFRLATELLRQKEWQISAAHELMDAFGLLGFKTALVLMSKAGIDPKKDEYECNAIYEDAAEIFDESSVDKCIDECEGELQSAKNFREAVARYKDDSRRSSSVQEFSLEDVLSLRCKRRSSYGRFGRCAAKEDLLAVLEALLKTSDVKCQRAYLEVFSHRESPRLDAKFISFVDAENPEEVRRAASQALSNCSDRRVRKKALSFLTQGTDSECHWGLELLQKNYNPKDASQILAALKRMTDRDALHRAGIDMDNLCENGGGNELLDCFLWMYENGPDSFCRRTFVEQIITWNLAPADLLFEAQWDVSEGVRQLSREYFAKLDGFVSH